MVPSELLFSCRPKAFNLMPRQFAWPADVAGILNVFLQPQESAKRRAQSVINAYLQLRRESRTMGPAFLTQSPLLEWPMVWAFSFLVFRRLSTAQATLTKNPRDPWILINARRSCTKTRRESRPPHPHPHSQPNPHPGAPSRCAAVYLNGSL